MTTSLKNSLAIVLLCLFAASAAFGQSVPPELNISLGEQRVKFAPTRSFQEMRLEVINSVGEIVLTHKTTEAEFDWNLRAANSEVLAPGLYRYALTLKFGEDQTRQHTGHFIVEKGQDQIWLTASDGAEVSGTALNATRSGGRSVAGFRTAEDKAVKRVVEGRELVDEKGNKLTDATKTTKQEKAALLGTLNRLAKFGASGNADTDSGIREDASGRLGFNINTSATTPYVFNGDIVNPGASLPAFILQSEADHARLEMRSAGAGAPIVQGRAASGTLGAPGATPLNQIMGGFGGSGYDTTNGFAQFSSGFIGINAAENWTSAAHGSYLTFGTTPKLSTTRTERMRISDAGNVGIGTNNPLSKLHLSSSDVGSTTLVLENLSGATSRQVILSSYGSTGAGNYWPGLDSANTSSLLAPNLFVLRSPGGLAFSGSSGGEHMRITTTGNVGIGSTSPGAKLEVINASGAAGVASFSTSTSGDNYGVYGSSNNSYGVYGRGFNSHGVYGRSDKIDSGGVFGFNGSTDQFGGGGSGVIGHSTNGSGVRGESDFGKGVHGKTAAASGIGVLGEAHNGTSPIGVYGYSTKGPGVYGINTSLTRNANYGSPGVRGHGDAEDGVWAISTQANGIYATGGNLAGYFDGKVYISGNLTVDGTFFNPSDVRLKQGVVKLGYGLAELRRLRPVTWRWKERPERGLQLGLIAQDVETVLPELVSTDKDAAQTKGVNYVGLTPVLINAIQEQQQQLDQQQTQIREQQAEIETLRQKLGQVKQQDERLQQQQQEMATIKQLLCASQPQAEFCKAKPVK